MNYKKLFIGGDHAGFELKEKIKEYLKSLNHKVNDMGAFSYDPNDDYPDFILPVTKEVVENPDSFGIIFGGSGQGEQIAANKRDGIRAIEYYGGDINIVRLGREHNDANILSIGARFIKEDEAKDAVRLFIETSFSKEERHERRIQKIKEIEIIN
jgi:ribose 5-phosphate isomerase B